MSSLSSLNAANFNRLNAASVIRKIGPQTLVTPGTAPTSPTGVDQVTLSPEALAASQDDNQTSRADRLAQIRAEIQAGIYDTDDKLTIVADRIARKLG